MPPRALLAVRTDIAHSIESEYLEWMTREHTIERVGIEGFLSARIFRSRRTDIRRFLILYELENVAVLDSPAYLERLNNPTPWSARMMPQLGNFIRSGGEIIRRSGSGYGAAIVPVLMSLEGSSVDRHRCEELRKASGMVAVRLLATDAARTSVPTREKSKRSDDRTFGNLLMLESLEETALLHIVKDDPALLDATNREDGENFVYSLLFCLTKASGS